jgi:hypothetical protein
VLDGQPDNAGYPTEEDRDRYLHLLDNARERGLLAVDEHANRVLAVGGANTFEELNRVVWELPVLERPAMARSTRLAATDPSVLRDPSAHAASGEVSMRKLDPVDVAMLQMRQTAKKPQSNRRWAALVAVALVFLVLIVLGVVLAAHTRSSSGHNGGLMRRAPAYSAPFRSS